MTVIDNAKLAADMEAVKQFLAYQGVDRKNPRTAVYICIAAQLAFQHNVITAHSANTLCREVYRRIGNRSTLVNYLKENEELPITAHIPGGYDLLDPAYIVIRDKFVDDIIKFYKEQT